MVQTEDRSGKSISKALPIDLVEDAGVRHDLYHAADLNIVYTGPIAYTLVRCDENIQLYALEILL